MGWGCVTGLHRQTVKTYTGSGMGACGSRLTCFWSLKVRGASYSSQCAMQVDKLSFLSKNHSGALSAATKMTAVIQSLIKFGKLFAPLNFFIYSYSSPESVQMQVTWIQAAYNHVSPEILCQPAINITEWCFPSVTFLHVIRLSHSHSFFTLAKYSQLKLQSLEPTRLAVAALSFITLLCK